MFAHVNFLFIRREGVVASFAQRFELEIRLDGIETIDGQGFLRDVIAVVLIQFGHDQSMLDQQRTDIHHVFIDEDQCTIEILHQNVEHVH